MDEVEKLYENAGINLGCCKHAKYGYEGEEGTWYYCTKENKECWTYPNGDADCVEKGYPPFTAEKQIALYCFILSQDKYTMTFEATLPLTPDIFAEGIAEATNRIWRDLTEEEKQQVKGILE